MKGFCRSFNSWSPKPPVSQYRFESFERFLYRLSVSPYHDRFVLKGGLLLKVLGDRLQRCITDSTIRYLWRYSTTLSSMAGP